MAMLRLIFAFCQRIMRLIFYCFVFEIQSRARFWKSAMSAQSVLKQWRVRAMYVRIFQNIWKNGILEKEVTDITDYWRDDFVYFLIGCSFSFESELLEADVPVRHIEENKNVPMFNTNIKLQPSGKFHGNMVVSMRPIPNDLVVKAVNVTASMPRVHGAPIQIGNPEAIGIKDVTKPDYGDSVTINEGEVPVFWACGVTPQNAVMQTKPEIAITHSPGHMFITDIKNVDLKY